MQPVFVTLLTQYPFSSRTRPFRLTKAFVNTTNVSEKDIGKLNLDDVLAVNSDSGRIPPWLQTKGGIENIPGAGVRSMKISKPGIAVLIQVIGTTAARISSFHVHRRNELENLRKRNTKRAVRPAVATSELR